MREGRQPAGNKEIWLIAIVLACFGLVMGYLVRWLRRTSQDKRAEQSEIPDITENTSRIMGLSSEEAATRQEDFDLEAEIRKEDRQFLRAALRQNLISIYNIDLFGIALILYLLGNPLGALGTLLIVALNLILNVFQQMYSKRKLNQILKDLRPQAAVIRDGVMRSIDPAMIVEGDYLVIRAGDEFLVDGNLVGSGEILVEQIKTNGVGHQSVKGESDQVFAGSYCLEGHTIYRASETGIQRYRAAPGSRLQLLLGKSTPIQRFMELVFRILFGLVLLIGVLLVADSLITGTNLISTVYQDSFSILFGIAPTSLIFILIITYAIGALRISDRGALVYKAQSIETLADASVLCISEESLVSGLQVDLDLFKLPAGVEPLSENLVWRILGDFVHSLPNLNLADQMLAQALPGEAHTSIEIVPYFSSYGWYAATFDVPDMRGTFVFGLPEVLEDNLVHDKGQIFVEPERRISKALRGITYRLRRHEHEDDDQVGMLSRTYLSHSGLRNRRLASDSGQTKKPRAQKMVDRFDQLLSPMEDRSFFQAKAQEHESDIHLIFAYLPEPVRILGHQDEPLLPENLIPVAHVGITAVLQPESGQTIRDLVEADLQVKMLSVDAPEEAARTALGLGLPGERLSLFSGNVWEDSDQHEIKRNIQSGNVFGDLVPSQKAAIIEALRLEGESVVMVGNSVQDVPAMQAANLRIALRNSDQATLKLTDIVLLKNSLEALPHVLITGQRLVNGILDVFKLYLSQTIAQMLIVLSILLFGIIQFPYHPTQAGIVSLFTIAIPGIFLSVWAAAGRVTSTGLRRQLAHFIIPSAITLVLLTWGVYAFFVIQTENEEYAQLTVTHALLMAGWLRVLFVQPPTPFWVGGAPMRGDRRVVGVVVGSILLFLLIISIPFFQEIMRITWLYSLEDYLLVVLMVVVWALITRTIWRSSLMERMTNKIFTP